MSGYQIVDVAGPSRPSTSKRTATGSNKKHRSREKKRTANIVEDERETQGHRERVRERERHRHRNGPYDSPNDRVKSRRRRSPSPSSSSSSSPEASPSPRPRSISRPKPSHTTPVCPTEHNYEQQGAFIFPSTIVTSSFSYTMISLPQTRTLFLSVHLPRHLQQPLFLPRFVVDPHLRCQALYFLARPL